MGLFSTFQTGGGLRDWIQQNIPRSVRQGTKDWLASQYPGIQIGQQSSDLGYNDPSRQMSVYDPINGAGYTPTSGPVQGPPGPAAGLGDQTPIPSGSGGGGGTGTETNPGALQSYLDMISQQSTNLGNQYQQGIKDTNSQYTGGVVRAQGQAAQGTADINSSLADYQKISDQNLQKTNQNAGQAVADTTVGMRNNFASRGALDSTFYNKALQSGLSTINSQQNDQVNYITDQLNTAKKTAQKQKDTITNQLYDALDQLQQKKTAALTSMKDQYEQGQFSLQQLQAAAGADVTKYASPEEIQNLAKLQSQSINIDDMISQIHNSAQAAIGQIQGQNKTAVNTNIDMTNVNNLLSKLGQGLLAGVSKADFIPMLTSQGYTPQDAQKLLDQAEKFAGSMALQPAR